jgi:hypothetical protein
MLSECIMLSDKIMLSADNMLSPKNPLMLSVYSLSEIMISDFFCLKTSHTVTLIGDLLMQCKDMLFYVQ